MPGGHTSRDNIIRIIECYKLGLIATEISVQVNVKCRTVSNIIAKYKAGGEKEIPVHTHGGGLLKKQSPRALRFIKSKLEANPTLTAKQLKESFPNVLGETRVRTIQKRISGDLGFKKVKAKKKPLVTEKQRKARVVFCKKVKVWPIEGLRKVLFTDEATFYTSDPAEEFEKTGTEILQQHGAPCHTAKIIKQGLGDCKVEYIKDWPGNSPDLSPIKNLWPIIKENLRNKDISTVPKPKLEEALKECWAALNPQICRNLIDSIPKRVSEVIKRKGLPTKYQNNNC
ncbi:uncharacterized protein [Palaemon carinicauda]|uniref:uncharacterized protein n=1 Tax=Palaemon carinicauda TaxID=392227 RepID=UPI0035B636EE